MPRAFAEWVSTKNSPGVFIISQKVDLLAAIEDPLLVWAASETEVGPIESAPCHCRRFNVTAG